MEFSNPSTEDGVVQEIDRICGSNNVTYTLKAKTARVNQGLDDFYTLALLNDKSWRYDGVNQTTLPIAVTDLKAGQQDYPFALELLTLNAVFVKDKNSGYKQITEETDPENTFLIPSDNTGTPTKFRPIGTSILLDFIPNQDIKNGLKISFGRTAIKMADSDTDKIPGIPTIFHPWLCRKASMPFLVKNRPKDVPAVLREILKDDELIKNYLNNRNATRKPRLVAKQESNR